MITLLEIMFRKLIHPFSGFLVHRIAIWLTVAALLATSPVARAFYRPWGDAELVKTASIIAVIEVQKVKDLPDNTHCEAKIIHGLLGVTTGEKIIVEDAILEDESGKTSRISGRDPLLEEGKKYLIYLIKDNRGAFITPHSASDAFEVKDGQVREEFGKKLQPLDQRLNSIRKLIKNRHQPKESSMSH